MALEKDAWHWKMMLGEERSLMVDGRNVIYATTSSESHVVALDGLPARQLR